MVKLSELREQYIITKSLLLAETMLDSVVDIRHREESDLLDIRAMLKTKPYSIMAEGIREVKRITEGGTVGNDNGTNQG